MELVYLWVEDYKNIKNQGFNFSPRFRCDYDPETNELTIEENKDYIENFFGENINITAIVGKNGSGKSSIVTFLEEIDYYIGSAYSNRENIKFIICLEINSKLKIISTITDIKYEDTKIINYVKKQTEYDTESSDYLFNNYCSLLTLCSEYPYENDERKHLHINNKTISYDSKKIGNLAIKNSKINFTFELTTFMMYPKKIFLSDNAIYRDRLIEYIQPIEAVYSNNPENGSSFPDCYEERKNIAPDNSLQAYMMYRIIKEADLCEYFFAEYDVMHMDKFPPSEEQLQNFYDNEEYELNKEEYNLNEYEELISAQVYEIENMTNREKELFIKYDKFLIYDFEDKKGRKFSDLSHGEKSIYAQFVSMYHTVVKDDSPTLIILDEPDVSLHPEWQRKYFYEFINSFLRLNKKIHLMITTHSPFLLSDIPKQNIIFLDTDENGNCKVVDGLNEKKETFGANIHTLLSDSFFMEDGLMGEFAKGKIDEIIDFHKKVEEENKKEKPDFTLLKKEYKNKKDKFWQTQSIIGEEYLKQVIKNHLVDIENILLGFDEAKQEEIKRVEAYLKSLKND